MMKKLILVVVVTVTLYLIAASWFRGLEDATRHMARRGTIGCCTEQYAK